MLCCAGGIVILCILISRDPISGFGLTLEKLLHDQKSDPQRQRLRSVNSHLEIQNHAMA